MRKGGAGIGSVTLIMLFSVLCLTVFAVLSLSSARAELNLTGRYVGSVEGFYEADTFASTVFTRLVAATDLYEEARAINLEYDCNIVISENPDGSYDVDYTRSIDDTLSLIVSLRFSITDVAVRQWEIGVMSWELLDSADWNADQRLEVWNGSELS